MSDVRCAWCGVSLPGVARPGRRYCGPAHRQAAWRARRRWQSGAQAREAMAAAGADLLLQVRLAAQQAGQDDPAGCCSAAVARVPELSEQLVRLAVAADRRAGASWAEIGAHLGLSAEAARGRFARRARPSPWVRQGGERGAPA
ncbi:hypothetical protein ACWCXL_34620 [Streptomyces sp. NPDC001588]